MDAERIARLLDYQRAAARMLTKDTIKGRAERDARLHELNLTSYAFAGALFGGTGTPGRDEFLKLAGVR